MIENQEINKRICRLLDNLIFLTDLFNEKVTEQVELSRKETEEQNTFLPLKNKQTLFLLHGEWTCPIKDGKELLEIKDIATRRFFLLTHYTMYKNKRAVKHLSHAIVDKGEERFLSSSVKDRFFFADELPLEYNKTSTKIRFENKIFTREED